MPAKQLTPALITGIVCCALNCSILPYDIYWLSQFYQCKNAYAIKKRKPGLLAIQHIAFWLWMFVLFPVVVIEHELLDKRDQLDDTWLDYIFGGIYIFFVFPLLCIFIGIAMSRYWLIFFMMQHNAAIANNQWQSVIDPRATAKNWYLENKTKYGSWSSIRRWVIMYTVALALMQLLFLTEELGEWNGLVMIIDILLAVSIVIAPIALLLFIWMKTPAFKDEIGIKSELRLSTLFFLLNTILVGAVNAVIAVLVGDSEEHAHSAPIAMTSYVFLLGLRMFYLCISLRSTRWPLLKFNEIILGRHDTERMIELAHQRTRSQETVAEDGIDELEVRQFAVRRSEMRQQLSQNEMFEAFMQLLLTEYCSECLLSVIEFIQFKQKILNDNAGQIELEAEDLELMPCLPASCPLSCIVYDDEACRDYMEMAMALYAKYIKVGAPYEINVDYGTRYSLANVFENKHNHDALRGNVPQLYQLFNPCMEQMMALITPSFIRFQHSKWYQLILHGQIPK